MKKILVTILALLYITASSGVVLNVHYCMGKISTVKVENLNSNFCKCGSSKKENKCCKSEFKVVKLSDDHKATLALFNFNIPAVAVPVYYNYNSRFTTIQSKNLPFYPAQSSKSVQGKIYLKNCIFLI